MSNNKWKSGIFYGGDRISYNESSHGELNNARYYNNRYTYYSDYTGTYKKSNQNQRCSIKDNKGRTDLFDACEEENLDLVKYLIEKRKLDVNFKDNDGKTVLFVACQGEYFDFETYSLVEYLVDRGADVNIKDNKGRTVLFDACEKENLKFVRYLVDHGTDVNIKDNKERTVLSFAKEHSNKQIVDYLISVGAKE